MGEWIGCLASHFGADSQPFVLVEGEASCQMRPKDISYYFAIFLPIGMDTSHKFVEVTGV